MQPKRTPSATKPSRAEPTEKLDILSMKGLVVAPAGYDPRSRDAGIPCGDIAQRNGTPQSSDQPKRLLEATDCEGGMRFTHVRLFQSDNAVVRAICIENGLASADEIEEALAQFTAMWVRTYDVHELRVLSTNEVSTRELLRTGRRDPGWTRMRRSVAAVDGARLDGFVVEDDRFAISLFVHRSAVAFRTEIDRDEGVPLSTLLARHAADLRR